MPQLDVTTYSSQVFWLVLCFSVLLIFAKSYIIPKMDSVILDRMRYVDSILAQASELTEKAERINEESERSIFRAKADIAKTEELAMSELNKKVELAQLDLNTKNAEDNSAALESINKAVQELSVQLNKDIPSMVNLAFNVMYNSIERK